MKENLSKNLFLFIAAMTVLMLIAGCGGGGDEGSSSTEAGVASTEEKADPTARATPDGRKARTDRQPRSSSAEQEKSEGESSGESGGSGGKAPPSSSGGRTAFAKQANALCTKTRKRGITKTYSYAAKHKKAGESSEESLSRAVAAVYLPVIQRQVDGIRELPPPATERQQVTAFLAAMQRDLNAARKLDTPTIKELEATFSTSSEMAKRLKLPACTYG